MEERARVRLIRASQSDELRSIFRQLSEIEGPEGPKFSHRVLLELAARIVGRAYEPTLHELCHLVRAAILVERHSPEGRRAAGAPGFEWLFWGVDTARTGAFEAAFASRRGRAASSSSEHAGSDDSTGWMDTVSVGDRAVTLEYTDRRFELRYARMAGLAAMMELLLSTLGYRALVDVLDPLGMPVTESSAVSGAARDLARRFYAWLGDHLPAAQAQRKFHAMISFLEEDCGPDFTVDDIDDETILRFWLSRGVESGPGTAAAAANFRGYRTTFLAFLALIRLLAEGAEIGLSERRLPIGPDYTAGEVDPAADVAIPIGVPEEDPLARLQEEPAVAVKALNRREIELLRLPVGDDTAVCRLSRSWLRAQCFGPVQNRLSQALRNGRTSTDLAAIVAAGPQTGYVASVQALEKTDAHLRRVAKACLYVLHRMGGADVMDGDSLGRSTVREIEFRILGEARKAFDGLNRAGFHRSAPNDPRLAPAYQALADILPEISERLRRVLHALGPAAAWEFAEVEDCPVFTEALTRLYGVGASKAQREPEAFQAGPCEKNSGLDRRLDDAANDRARPQSENPS